MLNNAFEYAVQTKGFSVSFRPSGFMWHNDLNTVCNHGLGMLLILRTALFFYAFVFCKENLTHNYKKKKAFPRFNICLFMRLLYI